MDTCCEFIMMMPMIIKDVPAKFVHCYPRPSLRASPRVLRIPSVSMFFLGKLRKIHLQEYLISIPHLLAIAKPTSLACKNARGLGTRIRSFPAPSSPSHASPRLFAAPLLHRAIAERASREVDRGRRRPRVQISH